MDFPSNPYQYNQAALIHYQRAQMSTEPLVEGNFDESIFSHRYQRNNKRGGLKNLRCFPSCGKEHRERGFCGRPVVVQVRRTHSNVVIPEIYCWAEFVKLGDSTSGSVKVHDRVSHTQVLTVERTKRERTKPWIRGELVHDMCTDDSIAFEFNRQRWGWHYGWTSNKHACNNEHALQCYVFQPIAPGSDTLVCLAVFQSPKFVLFCRRRRRFKNGELIVDDDAAALEDDSSPATTPSNKTAQSAAAANKRKVKEITPSQSPDVPNFPTINPPVTKKCQRREDAKFSHHHHMMRQPPLSTAASMASATTGSMMFPTTSFPTPTLAEMQDNLLIKRPSSAPSPSPNTATKKSTFDLHLGLADLTNHHHQHQQPTPPKSPNVDTNPAPSNNGLSPPPPITHRAKQQHDLHQFPVFDDTLPEMKLYNPPTSTGMADMDFATQTFMRNKFLDLPGLQIPTSTAQPQQPSNISGPNKAVPIAPNGRVFDPYAEAAALFETLGATTKHTTTQCA